MDNSYNIHKQILESKGMEFISKMRLFSFSFHIFIENRNELFEALKLVEIPQVGIALFDQNKRNEQEHVYREINRLFHNFLASAKTLVDHTRVFMNEHYKGKHIYNRYNSKIQDEFTNDPLSKFIQDLRNYMVHCGLPHSQMTLSFHKDDPDFKSEITLARDKLQEWSGWKSASNIFLSSQEEQIHFSKITNEYGNKVEILHNWLTQELNTLHKSDLDELKKLQEIQSKI